MRTISIGSHTIRIVRLVRDTKCCGLSFTPETVLPLNDRRLPYDFQYKADKRMRADIYSAIAKWLSEIGVVSVGGPILSGAVLAEGIASRSERLQPFYINKRRGLYKTFKHCEEPVRGTCLSPYAVVDDVISEGFTLNSALANLKQNNGDLDGLKVILVMNGGFDLANRTPLMTEAAKSGKVFGVWCHDRKRRRR